MRIERVNSELQKQIAKIIDQEIKNPVVKTAMTTVTSVKTTPDLKYAKVYLSIYEKDDEIKQQIFDAISGASSFIRNKLKNTVKIRLMPELTFAIDNSIDYGLKIDKILKSLNSNSDKTLFDKENENSQN